MTNWADVRFEAADITAPTSADAFARSVSNGWGTSDPLGEAYTLAGLGGSVLTSDWQVAGGVGTQSVPTTNAYRLSYLAGLDLADVDVTVACTLSVTVTGANLEPANIYLRAQDTSNYYLFRAEISPTGQAVIASIHVTGAGELARVATTVQHVSGTPLYVRAYARGRLLRMKVWQGDEPDAWALQVADDTFDSGWVGVRSGVASGNTNAKPVVFSYDDLHITEVWTDLSDRVLAPEASGGQEVLITSGRQTEHQDTEPSRLTLSLKNDDGELTPRNPLSAYPGWGPDVLVRLSDLLTGTAIPMFQGYVEVAEVAINLDGVDQPASVTAVDLLGKLASARSFVSNLGEYIIDAGRNRGLVAYWPCNDTSLPLRSAISAEVLEMTTNTSSLDLGSEQVAGVEFGTGTARPVDDIAPLRVVPALDTTGTATARSVSLRAIGPQGYEGGTQTLWRVLPGQVLTAVAWIDISLARGESAWPMSAQFSEGSGGGVQLLFVDYDAATGTFGVGVPLGDLTGSVSTDPVAAIYAQRDSAAFPIGFRFGFDPPTLELWIDRERYVGSLSGTATYDELLLLDGHVHFAGSFFDGTLAHCQLYVGGEDDFTFDDYLSQKSYGGLDRQTAAERVETIVRYATSTTADVDVPGAAATPLRQARLAGSGPVEQLRLAATAEQGILTTKPTGEITLVPRAQRYGQAAALEIPYAWLSRGLRYREDRPVRDVSVSSSGGGTARRTNQAVTAVNALAYTIDSAVAADAGNLADWTLDVYGRARTRCPAIAVNLRSPELTDADRTALLGLVEGDRITVTGLPGQAPSDAGDLIVLGREHRITGAERHLTFRTGPMLGPSDGVPPVGATVTETTATARTWSFVAAGVAATDGNASGTATLSPALPAGWQAGDLLLVLSSIRNSGTGTVDVPAGWRSFFTAGSSNRGFAARIAVAGDTAPTITFGGGVANATVIAQTVAFRPSFALPELTSTDQLTGAIATQLNGSAQNIAYPGLTVEQDNALIIWFGWKQDDWTSVAGPGTEIGEPDETAGDDAGQVWNYQIQTSAANISAGSWTVTGGASAISRGGVVALYSGFAGAVVGPTTLIGY